MDMAHNRKRAAVSPGFLLKAVFLALALSFLCTFKIVRVQGGSMEPTIRDGEFVLVTNLEWLVGDVQMGDIVLCRAENYEAGPLIKRICGVEGYSTIPFEVPPKLRKDARGPRSKAIYTVPPGQYFVLGDNTSRSIDSRDFGFLSRKEILGKCIRQGAAGALFPMAVPTLGVGLLVSSMWLNLRSRKT